MNKYCIGLLLAFYSLAVFADNNTADQFALEAGAIGGAAEGCGQDVTLYSERVNEAIIAMTNIAADQSSAESLFQRSMANAVTRQKSLTQHLACSDVLTTYNSLPIMRGDYKQTVIAQLATMQQQQNAAQPVAQAPQNTPGVTTIVPQQPVVQASQQIIQQPAVQAPQQIPQEMPQQQGQLVSPSQMASQLVTQSPLQNQIIAQATGQIPVQQQMIQGNNPPLQTPVSAPAQVPATTTITQNVQPQTMPQQVMQPQTMQPQAVPQQVIQQQPVQPQTMPTNPSTTMAMADASSIPSINPNDFQSSNVNTIPQSDNVAVTQPQGDVGSSYY